MKQFQYLDDAGNFDYERYRRVQAEGNRRKLGSQWVDEGSIQYLSDYIKSQGLKPSFGICHGTRRGSEQAWFSKWLDGCHVIGTEISDTATQFPNTVQWDFHEQNPDWIGKAGFVYSNSWDHSYDPIKMFRVWLDQLSQGGLMILEHSKAHTSINELDPFGIGLDELKALIDGLAPELYRVTAVLDDAPPIVVNQHKREKAERRGEALPNTRPIIVNYLVAKSMP